MFDFLKRRAQKNKRIRLGAERAEQERIAAAERMQEEMRIRAKANKRKRFQR
ncbi:MAG: hypothetical protein KJ955_07725 [Nanoarchaeota archaeon]|nr:hypothetical protein [Nanoarchaeota archaeon]